MNILIVYPQVAETFWSFKHALRVVQRKSAFPPLGALTVAALLPDAWQKRLVDMNVRSLRDEDLQWADYVFISAMVAQWGSTRKVLDRCRKLGVKRIHLHAQGTTPTLKLLLPAGDLLQVGNCFSLFLLFL